MRGVDAEPQSIVLYGGQWSASCPGHFTPGGQEPTVPM